MGVNLNIGHRNGCHPHLSQTSKHGCRLNHIDMGGKATGKTPGQGTSCKFTRFLVTVSLVVFYGTYSRPQRWGQEPVPQRWCGDSSRVQCRGSEANLRQPLPCPCKVRLGHQPLPWRDACHTGDGSGCRLRRGGE